MRRLFMVLIVLTMAVGLIIPGAYAQNMAVDEEDEMLVGRNVNFDDGIFGVYFDRGNRANHFIPSGWMGDYGDIKLDEGWKENPYSGASCIKFVYSAQGKQGANWAGVFWQNPANNWGEKKGGFDLREATKLTFWARGNKGGERIMEFKFGGISGTYPDSDSAGIGPVDLTAEWKQYEIDLADLDLSYVNGGFCWATNADSNPEGCTFYLDDIQYVK